MRRLILVLPLIFVLALVFAGTASAQGPYPAVNGCVADATGRLNAAEINAACGRLARSAGAKVFVLAYQDRGSADRDYDVGFTQARGLGTPGSNFDPRSVIVRLAFTVSSVKTKIYYGGTYAGALDPRIEQIDNGPNDPVVIDPTRGVTNRLEEIAQALQPATPVPSVVNVTQTQVDTSGIGNGLVIIVVLLILLLLGYAFWQFGLPALNVRVRLTRQIEGYRKGLRDRANKLVIQTQGDAKTNKVAKFKLLELNGPAAADYEQKFNGARDDSQVLLRYLTNLASQHASVADLDVENLQELLRQYQEAAAKCDQLETTVDSLLK